MPNVMIVDDEEDIVRLVSETLDLWGYNSVGVNDPEDALLQFDETPIDLVITDLKMPKMSGVELLNRIKTVSEETEVIVFTGYPEVNSAVEAMKNGAFDYLTKPIDLSELKLKVERGIEKKDMGKTIKSLRGLNWAMVLSVPVWLALGTLLAYVLKL